MRTSANALLMNAPSRLLGAFCEAPLVPAFPTFTLVSQRFDTSFLSLALASSRNSKRTQNSGERIFDCDHSTLDLDPWSLAIHAWHWPKTSVYRQSGPPFHRIRCSGKLKVERKKGASWNALLMNFLKQRRFAEPPHAPSRQTGACCEAPLSPSLSYSQEIRKWHHSDARSESHTKIETDRNMTADD